MFRHNNAKIRRAVTPSEKVHPRSSRSSIQPGKSQNQTGLDNLNRYLEIALNNMGRGISMVGADQRLILCNNTYRDLYALPEAMTKPGTPFIDILTFHVLHERRSDTGIDTTNLQSWIDGHVARLGEGQSIENAQRLSNGRTVRVSYQPLAGGGWVDIQEDITEQCEAERKINWLAKHDPMTGLVNRFHFRENLERALNELSSDEGLALHWLDLDHFKAINDTYGHLAGDALLRSFAERLKQVVRNVDIVGRLGGDEFAILQRGVTTQSQAKAFVDRLIVILAEPHDLDGRQLVVTSSIGTSFASIETKSGDSLFQTADIALYAAKDAGRATHKFFAPDQQHASVRQRSLEDELREAIRLEQFEVHYQPIVDVKRGQVNSIETLIRWRHPERGLIAPDTFIPVTESSALIVPIGAWVLRRACLDALTWPNGMKVTVNVSPVQFQRSDLAATVRAVLEETGLPPHRLELEITESVLLDNDAATTTALHAIRDLGIGIALDDFGTAFSSLSYLTKFPFNRIKVDRSFVKDLPERNDCMAIVNAVSGLARALKMVTTAEGVETSQQLAILQAAGCDEIQGYLFSRPVPADKLVAALSDCRAKLMVIASGDGDSLAM